MSGGAVKKVNPFDSQGSIGRAILTGGLSLAPELLLKATAPKEIGAPEAVAAPPTGEDPSVLAAEEAQRKARGRSSTILSGPGGGGSSGSGLIARRTLLGT